MHFDIDASGTAVVESSGPVRSHIEGEKMQVTGRQRSTPRFDELIVRVRGEYREMPGLSLTVPQAQRLWGLEGATCQTLFERLVETKFLRRTRHGRFVRCDVSSPITQFR